MAARELDPEELTGRVSKALGAPVAQVVAFTEGTSSLTYSTTLLDSGAPLVVKACPPGLQPVRNRDMARQARVQKALQGSPVPAPAVVAEDEGDPPEVPPFFVMELVAGVCVELGSMPPEELPPPEDVRGRQLHCAQLMGELHRLDPAAIGLGDEPVTTLEAEVQRWIDAFAVCDEDLRAGTEDIGERLRATAPTPMPARLLHGDFRTGNVLAEGDHVTSVIDWEIWSIGDPRIDLAWFLLFVEDERRTLPPGTPTIAELSAAYEAASGVPVEDLDWFKALVRYKQVSAGAFITRNARRRGAEAVPVDNAENWLLQSARQLLGI